MPLNKKLSPSVTKDVSGDRNISIGGDVVDSVVIAGDSNKVNILKKFFNIFKSDAETVDQRNRRIMLGHVENFWVKGILEKSLHGAALLDLGIKEDPDALSYPWAIKREANKETLPAGTSMLEIFQEIGMGRSLLILGTPGSGKTTMLLELTRQLIERAREDVTEPIPVVFNLSSWTEKLTLADWLARELNVIYTIPKKVAPTWVKENKILLLLDGLDEVKQESRDKCVDAINLFRKENGLTSLVVCSRIQDYAELKTRLSFDGAIEIQPLTPNQVDKYFKRFGKGLAGIRQVLEKDTVLREMAETPLFLSIMTLAYSDTKSGNIPVTGNIVVQRKHLFDTYIARMFERPARSRNLWFKKQQVLPWLSLLAQKIIEYNQIPYLIENIQPYWLSQKKQRFHKFIIALILGLVLGLVVSFAYSLIGGLILGLSFALVSLFSKGAFGDIGIYMVDNLSFNWSKGGKGLIFAWLFMLITGGLLVFALFEITSQSSRQMLSVIVALGLIFGLYMGFRKGLSVSPINQTVYPGQRITLSIRNSILISLLLGVGMVITIMILLTPVLFYKTNLEIITSVVLLNMVVIGLKYGGDAVIQHYVVRLLLAFDNILPWQLPIFLDHCVDLIFLRRVGGGYIFVHRLLMEHFADMYPVSDK